MSRRYLVVRVGGETRDQDIGLALGIKQMPDVTRMHEIEDPMTHDHRALPWPRADRATQLFDILDLVAEGLGQLGHVIDLDPK